MLFAKAVSTAAMVKGACAVVVTVPTAPNAPYWATNCAQSCASAAPGAAARMVASSIASADASSPRASAATNAAPIDAGSPLGGLTEAAAPDGPAGGAVVRAGEADPRAGEVVAAPDPQAANRSGTRMMSARRDVISPRRRCCCTASRLQMSVGSPGCECACFIVARSLGAPQADPDGPGSVSRRRRRPRISPGSRSSARSLGAPSRRPVSARPRRPRRVGHRRHGRVARGRPVDAHVRLRLRTAGATPAC